MKAFLVFLLVIPVAVTAVAYGPADVVAAVMSHSSHANEPAALLLSGSFLLGLAGALRRFSV